MIPNAASSGGVPIRLRAKISQLPPGDQSTLQLEFDPSAIGATGVFLDNDFALIIDARNSLAGLGLLVTFREVTDEGYPVFGQVTIPPLTSARARNVFSISVPRGWLMSLHVANVNGEPRRGETWVTAAVQKSNNILIGVPVFQILVQDYLCSGAPLTWPGSPIRSSVEERGLTRSVIVANPAAGADWSTTVPVNARWILRSVEATIAGDGGAGAKRPQLQLLDAAAVQLLFVPAFDTYTLLNVKNFQWMDFEGRLSVGTPIQVLTGMPDRLELFQGWQIGTITTGITAGDQWTGIALIVEEYIEE